MALGKDCYPLQVDRYGAREYLLRNRDLYLFSYRIVGLGIDSNVLSPCYLPQLLHFRTRCLGEQVARFLRPFEARPTDPVRRELYRQLAEKPCTAATSGWVAPTEALASTPPPLGPGTEESAGRNLPCTKKRKRSSRQPSASGL